MKKRLLLSALVALNVILFCRLHVRADGGSIAAPGPVIGATGAFYVYPSSAAPAGGGVLVNDGVGAFAWSNTVVTTTTTVTGNQLISLPRLTIAQLGQLTPATTGQIVSCSNCTAQPVCVSSGIGTGAWVGVANSTTTVVFASCK